MLLSLNNSFFKPKFFSLEQSIEKTIEAGFSSIDVSLIEFETNPLFLSESAVHLKNVKRILSQRGAVIHQAHSPFPHYKEGEDEFNKKAKAATLRSIELAAELGAKYIIVHPMWFKNDTPAVQMEKNLALYAPYGEMARKCGIKIAVENMWGTLRDCPDKISANVCSTAEELAAYADALGDPFVVCLDVGHAGLTNETADKMIPILGKRLRSLHIHDNDFYADHHTAPFHGAMNWDALTSALAAVGYDESFTYEVGGSFTRNLPGELYLPAAKYLYEIGSYLVNEIERKKI